MGGFPFSSGTLMIETPELFLAADCPDCAAYRRADLAESDRLSFEPGFPALNILCLLLTGRLVTDWLKRQPDGPLEYVDGPPDPDSQEGFQLSRLSAAVVGHLAGLTVDGRETTAAGWQAELVRLGLAGPDPSVGTVALARLAAFARRAGRESKSLYSLALVR